MSDTVKVSNELKVNTMKFILIDNQYAIPVDKITEIQFSDIRHECTITVFNGKDLVTYTVSQSTEVDQVLQYVLNGK